MTFPIEPTPTSIRRAAGVAVPLSSLRGHHDAGTGEIFDLFRFIDWLAEWEHRVVQLLPLNEADPEESSPYSALSAFAIDPSYISASRLGDVENSSPAREWLASGPVRRRLKRLAAATRRPRKESYAFKISLLQFGFAEFQARATPERRRRFAEFCRENAWWLDDFALFLALKERHRFNPWEEWPEELRHRDPVALSGARQAHEHQIGFAQYMQWTAAEQWGEVRAHARKAGVLIKGDLPFVCGRDSADVWAHPELFDPTSSAGAPPDAFSATGQAWGLPLYNWQALRASDYGWWRQRARQARGLYDMFRVDHVVGLYRTYAIPVEEGGTHGFVPSDPHDQWNQGHGLMGALVDESRPAAVLAEDLGTVPDWVRESLFKLGVPGYKVFRWEQNGGEYTDPRDYPVLSIATTGTHDTDTLPTWWQHARGADRYAISRAVGLAHEHPRWPEVHRAILQRLYEAASVLTILPVQDLFGWHDRINVPATVDDSNWSWRLPAPIDSLNDETKIHRQMTLLRDLVRANRR